MSWGDLALYLLASTTVGLLIARLLFDDQVKKSLRRSKADIVEMQNEWFKDRNEEIDEAIELTKQHEDRMQAYEESMMQQGLALNRAIEDHTKAQTKTLETMTATLVALQTKTGQTAEAVARIEGAMQRMSSATSRFNPSL